jgi:hypothetical protein
MSAGKARKYDFIYDRIHGTVSWRDGLIGIPNFSDVWLMPVLDVSNTTDAGRDIRRMFPRRNVPDVCEMGVGCNQTGLMPYNKTFHAPHAKTLEVPEVFRPEDARGIFSTQETIDLFNCLRRAEE